MHNSFIQEIPKLNPLLPEYIMFWKEEKRRCIKGLWALGRYMPPTLYFYINYWHILIKKCNTCNESLGLPFLRDIDWMIHIAYMRARGFSRFSKQPEEIIDPESPMYKSPQEILEGYYEEDMGDPLYENPRQNVFMMGPRGFGKSYSISGIVGHTFLFYQEDKEEVSEILIGAEATIYSSVITKFVERGLDNLPGAIEMNNVYYPCPFAKQYTGSWAPGSKGVVAKYSKKIGNQWIDKGSGNIIHHRSFKDKPTAGNGVRPRLTIFEEAGLFSNLIESFNAVKESIMNGSHQFGTIFMIGTGGDMGKGTLPASQMFYKPHIYNLVTYEDRWENKSKKGIGLFIPATLAFNDCRTIVDRVQQGPTDEVKALKIIESERARLVDNVKALNDEIQYRPLVPSEIFLAKGGNIFPIALLQKRLATLENNIELYRGQEVELYFTDENKIQQVTSSENNYIYNYPMESRDSIEGGVKIWEPPLEENGFIPHHKYIAGCDPYDHDQSNSGSLGSVFIYKRVCKATLTSNVIVAEYSGRPARGAETFYENVRKLCLYYNATMLFENEKILLQAYFNKMNSSYLLVDQPDELIKGITPKSTVTRNKGIHMSTPIKMEGEGMIADWLNKPGIIDNIYSIPLLKELIYYNSDGNFDRVMALMMTLFYNEQIFLSTGEERKKAAKARYMDDFFFKYKQKRATR